MQLQRTAGSFLWLSGSSSLWLFTAQGHQLDTPPFFRDADGAVALQSVNFQGVRVGKFIVTLAATVWLLSRVCPDMLVEIVLAGKDGGAKGAFIRPLARVAVDVILEAVCFEEAPAALVAAERSVNLGVATFRVGLQLGNTAERSVTLCAAMRLLALVDQNVHPQGIFLETHPAVFALRIPPLFVLLHMIPQSR